MNNESALLLSTFLPNFNDIIIVGDIIFNNPTTNFKGQGEWTVTQATAASTPEPSSFVPAALILFVVFSRKWIAILAARARFRASPF